MMKSQEELVEMYQGLHLICLARLREGSLETISTAFDADGRPEQCRAIAVGAIAVGAIAVGTIAVGAIEGDATEVGGTRCLAGLMALVQESTVDEEEKKKKIAAVRVCSQSQCCGYQYCKSFVENWREVGTSRKWSHHTECSECC